MLLPQRDLISSSSCFINVLPHSTPYRLAFSSLPITLLPLAPTYYTFLLCSTVIASSSPPTVCRTSVAGGESEEGLVCSGQHGRAQTGLSVLLASFFLVAQVSGLGVLALPWAVAQTGQYKCK